jgi:hypothetical protein
MTVYREIIVPLKLWISEESDDEYFNPSNLDLTVTAISNTNNVKVLDAKVVKE